MRSVKNMHHFHVELADFGSEAEPHTKLTFLRAREARATYTSMRRDMVRAGATFDGDPFNYWEKGTTAHGQRFQLRMTVMCEDIACLYEMARKNGCVDWADYYWRVVVGIELGSFIVKVRNRYDAKSRESVWLVTTTEDSAQKAAERYLANPEVGRVFIEWECAEGKLRRDAVGGEWRKIEANDPITTKSNMDVLDDQTVQKVSDFLLTKVSTPDVNAITHQITRWTTRNKINGIYVRPENALWRRIVEATIVKVKIIGLDASADAREQTKSTG